MLNSVPCAAISGDTIESERKMFARQKTELETSETPEQQAGRFREALLVIYGSDDLVETKRIAIAVMRGELHGYEMKPDSLIRQGLN